MADSSYAIPVYPDWPEKPYEVIGSVRFVDPRRYWDDGIIRMAATNGKQNNGDALVLRFGGVTPASWLDSWVSRPTGYGQEITALVIRWTPDQTVRARLAEREKFWTQLRQQHPRLFANEQLVQLAEAYLLDSGTKPNTPEMESKLVQLLSSLSAPSRTGLTGQWLFKGVVQNKSMTMSQSESFFGVATAAMTGERLTIISTQGNVELNFSGTVDSGQIRGMLGFGGANSSLSVACEGVALESKISLAFQKLTEGGTVQGNLVLQR